jgi:hypothetical protein
MFLGRRACSCCRRLPGWSWLNANCRWRLCGPISTLWIPFRKKSFIGGWRLRGIHNSFVSDRSFDNLAYAAQHARVLQSILQEKEFAEYLDRMRQSDVVLFYVRPVQATLRNDGIREQIDWDELVRIDGAIKFMLEMWGLQYFMIHSSSMQERARLVDAVLQKKTRRK